MDIEEEFDLIKSAFQVDVGIKYCDRLWKINVDGLYFSEEKTIVLPKRYSIAKESPSLLITLLHEICHAIQDRENRLFGSLEDRYENEVEACSWALFKYYKQYYRRFGHPPHYKKGVIHFDDWKNNIVPILPKFLKDLEKLK